MKSAASKILVPVLAATSCLSVTSIAQAAPLDDVYACAAIDDSTQRLACFDAAVGQLQQAEATGEIRTISRAEVEAVEKDAFGFNLPTLPRLKGLFGVFGGSDDDAKTEKRDALTAPVARNEGSGTTRSAAAAMPTRSLSPSTSFEPVDQVVHGLRTTKEFGASKKTRFYLDNGQVWDQVDSRRVRIPKVRDGGALTVEIRRAALGSYLLRVNGEGAAVRVRRRR